MCWTSGHRDHSEASHFVAEVYCFFGVLVCAKRLKYSHTVSQNVTVGSGLRTNKQTAHARSRTHSRSFQVQPCTWRFPHNISDACAFDASLWLRSARQRGISARISRGSLRNGYLRQLEAEPVIFLGTNTPSCLGNSSLSGCGKVHHLFGHLASAEVRAVCEGTRGATCSVLWRAFRNALLVLGVLWLRPSWACWPF